MGVTGCGCSSLVSTDPETGGTLLGVGVIVVRGTFWAQRSVSFLSWVDPALPICFWKPMKA